MRPLARQDAAKVKPSTLIHRGRHRRDPSGPRHAEAGLQVHLVERNQSIGATWLNSTRPSHPGLFGLHPDPQDGPVAQHPNIELLTLSRGRGGGAAAWASSRSRCAARPTCVDNSKCTGCGICISKCPVKKVPSEFDEKAGLRPAIYTMFSASVPTSRSSTARHCKTMFVRGKCGVAEKFCEPGAINMKDEDSVRELEVAPSSWHLATTSPTLPSSTKGLRPLPRVYTGLEFERLLQRPWVPPAARS